jgi:hypothetical protein
MPVATEELVKDFKNVERIYEGEMTQLEKPRRYYIKSSINELLRIGQQANVQQHVIYFKGRKKPSLLLTFED